MRVQFQCKHDGAPLMPIITRNMYKYVSMLHMSEYSMFSVVINKFVVNISKEELDV